MLNSLPVLSAGGRGTRAPLRRRLTLLLACLVWGVASQAFAQGSPVTFSVIGDIPYGSADLFQGYIDDHNLMSPADFFVHVGDIMSAGSCPEPSYALVSDIMSQLAVPAFIIPGDNEWNDCDDPAAAWTLWESYFTEFEQRFCGTPPVEAQPVRQENFAFVDRGVLFVGLNLVGGAVHDRAEWDVRLQQDADWIDQQFTQMQSQVRAAVVFGHAARDGSRDIFFNQFDLSAAAFGKPIMFLHGNGHSWTYDTNWGLPNIWRIQVEKNDPPLEFTVTMDPLDPFVFERDPWPGGTPPYNRPPCVEVGPDQSIRLGEGVRVDGFTTDDGVPAPAGLSTTWSKASGPGQASFADPGALATDVTFSQPGVYVLRLTADDGGLASSGDVTVQVASGDPDFRIQDVSVTEGQSGTGIAAFTVQLLSATGAPASVDYATADGTATAGEDYQATSGTLSFSGSTISQTINVVVYGDEDLESSESFAVELSNAVGAGILDGTATGSILDDDIPPPPTVNAFDPPFALPGATVVVTGEFFTDALSVSVAGVPADFVIVSGTHLEVIVPDGIVTGPIRVTTPTGTGVSGESFDIAYTLSLELTGEGGVGLDPPGGLYAQGSTVTLTPLPDPGAEFLVWGGDIGGIDVPAEIAMDRSKLVTAWFVDEGSVARAASSVQLASDLDDAEERVSSGSMDLSSSDLELGVTGGSAQLVGMRFVGLDVPRRATILSASLQFTADETNGDAAELHIHGQAADYAAPFAFTTGDISGRTSTQASAEWNPPDWKSAGAAGAAERSADVSSVVQEIVDRPGWLPGNALALIVTGSGTRTAESHEGDPAGTVRLDMIHMIDLKPPGPAAGLRATAVDATSIDLAWDPARDNVAVTGYRLFRPTGYVDVIGTSHRVTGLTPDREYFFQVSALDATGFESPPTPILKVRTAPLDRQAPTTPQGLHSPAQAETSLDLAWDAASDNVAVTGYRLYLPNGPLDVAGTSYSMTGLAPDRVYGFQVAALDAAGHESAPSPVLLVSTRRPDREAPTAPQGLGSPAQTVSTIELGWEASSDDVGVTGYRVHRMGGSIDVVGTSYTETGLAPGQEYGFQVSALDAAGHESAPSSLLQVRTLALVVDQAAPTSPQNLHSPAQTGTSVDLAWDASSDDMGVAGYRVYSPSGIVDVVGTTYTATGLSEETEYGFQVSALDTAGQESAPSPVLMVSTTGPGPGVPTTPTNLRSPVQTRLSIDLVWDASTDDVGVVAYRVYGPSGPVDVPGTTHTESDLDSDTWYEFQVSALDADGNESPQTSVLHVRTRVAVPVVLSIGVAGGDDDAEEDVVGGSVNTTSGDLELAVEGGVTAQVVGMRFAGIGVPRDAAIMAASVQFTVDEVTGGGSALTIRGEAADDAAPFVKVDGDVTSRPTTSAAVAWSPPDWTSTGEAGADQRTPDLSPVIEEIVGRVGWSPGNAIGLIVTGTGTRTAESYDGAPAAAPQLQVTYLPAVDAEAPSAPSNLRSTTQTSFAIDLEWDASTDDIGVTGYRVYGPHGPIDVPGTGYTEGGLVPGTEYAFFVTALDAVGRESAASETLLVSTLPPDVDPPTTPQNLRSPSQIDVAIDLAWDPSSDDRGVVGYRVYGPGGAVDVPGTSYTATGLVPITSYDFQVSALDEAGNESVLSAVLSVSTLPPIPLMLSVPVSSGADDAEENVATGAVNLTSTDLDVVTDRNGNVYQVGLRFAGVTLPPGASITGAWIQFNVDEVGSLATDVEIRAEAADDAAPFTSVAFDVSSRPSTTSFVPWSVAPWAAIDDAGLDQRTPDLAVLVQEVIGRPGWVDGGSLVLLVSGSGQRVADSYEGGAALAPVLVIEYLQ
jgi:chitodextrinase